MSQRHVSGLHLARNLGGIRACIVSALPAHLVQELKAGIGICLGEPGSTAVQKYSSRYCRQDFDAIDKQFGINNDIIIFLMESFW